MSAPVTHLEAYDILSPAFARIDDMINRLGGVKEQELPAKIQEIRIRLQGLNARLGQLIGAEELYEVPATPLSEAIDRMRDLVVTHLDGNPHNNKLDNIELVEAKVYYSQQFGPRCPECGSAAVRTDCSLFRCDDCSAYGHGETVEGHL